MSHLVQPLSNWVRLTDRDELVSLLAELHHSLIRRGEAQVWDFGSLEVSLRAHSPPSISTNTYLVSFQTDLCELQAGRIEVASTVGEGSIFRCFITARSVDRGLKKDDSRAIPVIEGITAPNACRGEVPRVFLSKPEEDSAPLNGFRVLCCEVSLESRLSPLLLIAKLNINLVCDQDNQINRTVLKRQLMKEGVAEVLLACDGQEGIDMLYQQEPGAIDCILMDIEVSPPCPLVSLNSSLILSFFPSLRRCRF